MTILVITLCGLFAIMKAHPIDYAYDGHFGEHADKYNNLANAHANTGNSYIIGHDFYNHDHAQHNGVSQQKYVAVLKMPHQVDHKLAGYHIYGGDLMFKDGAIVLKHPGSGEYSPKLIDNVIVHGEDNSINEHAGSTGQHESGFIVQGKPHSGDVLYHGPNEGHVSVLNSDIGSNYEHGSYGEAEIAYPVEHKSFPIQLAQKEITVADEVGRGKDYSHNVGNNTPKQFNIFSKILGIFSSIFSAHKSKINNIKTAHAIPYQDNVLNKNSLVGVSSIINNKPLETVSYTAGIHEHSLEGASFSAGIPDKHSLKGASFNAGIPDKHSLEGASFNEGIHHKHSLEGVSFNEAIHVKNSLEGSPSISGLHDKHVILTKIAPISNSYQDNSYNKCLHNCDVSALNEDDSKITAPHAGDSSVTGPRAGEMLLKGADGLEATVVGPHGGHSTVVGPKAGKITIIGPTEEDAKIHGVSSIVHGDVHGDHHKEHQHGEVLSGPRAIPVVISGPSGKIIIEPES